MADYLITIGSTQIDQISETGLFLNIIIPIN